MFRYVCFDNNARAQYRARELKSIKINADAEYVRLVARNCHQNKLNSYNQIGIIALNILGQPTPTSSGDSKCADGNLRRSLDDVSLLSCSTRRSSVSSNHSIVNNLSASAVVEIELQQWISALLHAEKQAAKDEAFQLAKIYKVLGDKLSQFANILDGLEMSKKQAVETKDYDEAGKIKADINEIKLSSAKLLQQAGIRVTSSGQVVPLNVSNEGHTEHTVPACDNTTDLTLLENFHESTEQHLCEAQMDGTWENKRSLNEECLIGSNLRDDLDKEFSFRNSISFADANEKSEIDDPDNIPEPLTDEDKTNFVSATKVFGEDVVACVLSVKGKCRERGLTYIEGCIQRAYKLCQAGYSDRLTDLFHQPSSDDNNHIMFIDATVMMLQAAIRDSREGIVSMAITMWEALNLLCVTVSQGNILFTQVLERAFLALLKRAGDNNSRIRQAAVRLVLKLAKIYPVVPIIFGHAQRPIYNHKEAKARLELVEETIIELGVAQTQPDGVIELEGLMEFTVSYLNHSHEEVREAALKLLNSIVDKVGSQNISTYINDSVRTSLTEVVQNLQVASGPSKDRPLELKDLATQLDLTLTLHKGTKNAKPPSALSEKSNDSRIKKRTLVENKARAAKTEVRKTAGDARSVTKKDAVARTATSRNTPKLSKKPKTKAAQIENKDIASNVCIFCDEVNPEFNEDTLIAHYYNACPVLTNCPMCETITEISTLRDHAFSDCTKKHMVKQCGRCKQPISVEQWLQHTLKQNCPEITDASEARCSLCLTVIDPPTEANWKEHLLGQNACPKNPRSRQYEKPTVAEKKAGEVAHGQRSTTGKTTKTLKPGSANGIIKRKK
ncbi:hypothetical protein EC973_004582 [Apophysomyces ossiformis]|uniref:TOG domain-containing protein n=1 Tax=Apophysomyces ossiformis TaxID=679940 RepID=A0A8H7BWR9_9FUNG|nr:hypothetical protein EC973_004582 [Apophysomyces ossiformis]